MTIGHKVISSVLPLIFSSAYSQLAAQFVRSRNTMKKRFVCCLLVLVCSLSLWTALFSQSVQNNHWRKLGVSTEYDHLALPAEEHVLHATNHSDAADHKPLFILHVGPSKTGTTSIQWFAATHEKLLHKSNFHYLGHFKNASSLPELNLHVLSDLCYACKKDPRRKETCMDPCHARWKEFEASVNRHYELGHNVFVSNELFSGFRDERYEIEPLWNPLLRIIDQHKWDVRVILAYRRYHEWVPSKYFQLFNPNAKNRNQAWTDEGGRTPPLFSEYYESHKKDTFKHPAILRHKWQKYFSNVWVFNMHESNNSPNLVQSFYCKMLPEAKHACKYLKRLQEQGDDTRIEINSSTKKVVHFDMLAVEAFRRGWIKKNSTHSRTAVWQAAKEFAENKGMVQLSDFPRKCLTKAQVKEFLTQTLELEKEMVPDFYNSPSGKQSLSSSFWQAVKQGKFCSVHVNKVLKQEKWKRFFHGRFGGKNQTKG